MHNHKRAHRASPANEMSKRHDKPADEAIFSSLANPKLFEFGDGNRNERKALEQKWSFTEIIRFLSANPPDDFDLRDALGLLHMYGLQSHLIHADDSALDLMLDRRLRAPDELKVLACSHISRIFSDQSSLWTFSTMALRYRYGGQTEIGDGLINKLEKVHDLTKPFSDRFNASQEEFYRKIGSHQS